MKIQYLNELLLFNQKRISLKRYNSLGEKHIQELEKKYSIKLPTAVKEYWYLGMRTIISYDESLSIDELQEAFLEEYFEAFCTSPDFKFFNLTDHYTFIKPNEGENPPVYQLAYSQNKGYYLTQLYSSLSEFVEKCFKHRFRRVKFFSIENVLLNIKDLIKWDDSPLLIFQNYSYLYRTIFSPKIIAFGNHIDMNLSIFLEMDDFLGRDKSKNYPIIETNEEGKLVIPNKFNPDFKRLNNLHQILELTEQLIEKLSKIDDIMEIIEKVWGKHGFEFDKKYFQEYNRTSYTMDYCRNNWGQDLRILRKVLKDAASIGATKVYFEYDYY